MTPEEAEQVLLNDPVNLESEIRNGELRQPHLGETDGERILMVITTWEGNRIRVVTPCPAKERLRFLAHSTERGIVWQRTWTFLIFRMKRKKHVGGLSRKISWRTHLEGRR